MRFRGRHSFRSRPHALHQNQRLSAAEIKLQDTSKRYLEPRTHPSSAVAIPSWLGRLAALAVVSGHGLQLKGPAAGRRRCTVDGHRPLTATAAPATTACAFVIAAPSPISYGLQATHHDALARHPGTAMFKAGEHVAGNCRKRKSHSDFCAPVSSRPPCKVCASSALDMIPSLSFR